MKKCQPLLWSVLLAACGLARHTAAAESSPTPEAAQSSILLNLQQHWNITARGTEHRTMHRYASGNGINSHHAPGGPAGPASDDSLDIHLWGRVFGSSSERDADGTFGSYDHSYRGAIIGIDKTIGNLLVGAAGSYTASELEADSSGADADTYFGTLFSTYSRQALFIDIALTYGRGETEEKDDTATAVGTFTSDLYSVYLGSGYVIDIAERITLTPAVSLLTTYYDQDAYSRTGPAPGSVHAFATHSSLASIGINLSTPHQIDWLKYSLAYIPEVRAHYIHEFNADLDSVTVTSGGGSTPYAARPLEEHFVRLGFGVDVWSWKYEQSKIEFDYNALLSEFYLENIISVKLIWNF